MTRSRALPASRPRGSRPVSTERARAEGAKRMPRYLILSVLCFAALAGPAAAQTSRSVTFDFLKTGSVPGAFDCDVTGPGGPGRWVVIQAMAEGGIRRVLAQTSQVADASRMPYCLLK